MITTAHFDSKLCRAPNALRGLSRREEQRIRQLAHPQGPQRHVSTVCPSRTVGSGRGEVDRGCVVGYLSYCLSYVIHTVQRSGTCRVADTAKALARHWALHKPPTEAAPHPEVPILRTLAIPAWVTDRPLPCRPREISALQRKLLRLPAIFSVAASFFAQVPCLGRVKSLINRPLLVI